MEGTGQSFSVERLGPLHRVAMAPDARYEQGHRWMVSSNHNACLGRSFFGAFIGWLKMVR